ncbi:MAG: ATP synthase subunit I [Armatimonadota bacterium]
MLDIGFIKRVYKTSLAVFVFSLLWCAALRSVTSAIGITIGFVISLGSIMIIERLVTTLFTPEQTKRRKRSTIILFLLMIGKYAIIGAVLWLSLKSGWASPIGIAIGIGLPLLVISLKAVARVLSPVDRRS